MGGAGVAVEPCRRGGPRCLIKSSSTVIKNMPKKASKPTQQDGEETDEESSQIAQAIKMSNQDASMAWEVCQECRKDVRRGEAHEIELDPELRGIVEASYWCRACFERHQGTDLVF